MRLIKLIILPALLILASCKSGWDSSAQDLFLQACMEDADARNATDAQKEAFCNCRLQRAMEKYPDLSDALSHQDSLIADEGMMKCVEELRK